MESKIKQQKSCIECKHKVDRLDDTPQTCWNCRNYSNFESKENIEEMKIKEREHNPLETQIGGNHYKTMKIQPAEYAVKNNLNPMQTLALRYISRTKGNTKEDIIRDRRKAIHCIEMEIKFIEEGDLKVV